METALVILLLSPLVYLAWCATRNEQCLRVIKRQQGYFNSQLAAFNRRLVIVSTWENAPCEVMIFIAALNDGLEVFKGIEKSNSLPPRKVLPLLQKRQFKDLFLMQEKAIQADRAREERIQNKERGV